MPKASLPNGLSRAVAKPSSSRPSRNHGSAAGINKGLCSTRAKGFRPRTSSTRPLQQRSTESDSRLMPGERCRAQTIGASRQRLHACCNTGAITISAGYDPSSARSRQQRPSSGSRKSLQRWGEPFCRSSPISRGASLEANPELTRLGAEAGYRRGQDHRHGDAHRLADRQRSSAAQQQPVHARIPGRRARSDHQGPPARAAAQRPGQLLRQQGTGPSRHGGRS